MTEQKFPQLSEFTKNAARAVVASDVGLAALEFANRRLSPDSRLNTSEAFDTVYAALYREHRYRVHTLLRMLLASDDIDAAKRLAWEEFKGGHVDYLGHPELSRYNVLNAEESDALKKELEKALLRGGV